jgi:phage tail-like protein
VAVGDRRDPYTGLRFRVEVEGLQVGGFSEVGGLQARVETTPYREGGNNQFEYQLPGPVSYPGPLTLRHGLTDGTVFWDWFQQIGLGLVHRRNLTVSLLGPSGEPAVLWDCRQAFPVTWTGPELTAASAVTAVEAIELAHQGITRATGRSLIAVAESVLRL